MKIKIWPDDTTVPEMDEWLAELRDDRGAEPPDTNRAEPFAAPVAPAEAAAAEAPAEAAAAEAPAEAAAAEAPAEALAEPAAAEAPAEPAAATVRAVIGDQLRKPIIWCEMGSCISWHADPAALGEGDARARAIGAGWRLDAFGRMACPSCQQADPHFRNPYPVVPWDRHTAIARAARAAVRAPGR